jgi:hypothetical protein
LDTVAAIAAAIGTIMRRYCGMFFGFDATMMVNFVRRRGVDGTGYMGCVLVVIFRWVDLIPREFDATYSPLTPVNMSGTKRVREPHYFRVRVRVGCTTQGVMEKIQCSFSV